MSRNKLYTALVAFLVVAPLLASAQFSATKGLIREFSGIVQSLTIIAASIALLVFIWGLVKYIAKADDAGEKEAGRTLMIQGSIALFVLFSIFGIIRWIGGEVIIDSTLPIAPPTIPLPPNGN